MIRLVRRHPAPAEHAAGGPPQSRAAPAEPTPDLLPAAEHDAFVRQVRKDGRLVAVLRAFENEGSWVVEAEVHPQGGQVVRPGPYRFGSAQQAGAFATEALTALVSLGCDVQAQP